MKPIEELARDLRSGAVTSRMLIEAALERIDDSSGEGSRTFMTVWRERARAMADHVDRCELWRTTPSPLCGIPLSVKDVFDIGGEITRAGSRARESATPASADALSVQRLRSAGAILLGRTTMSEFAFSGIGLNRHYGTPTNPWDRETGRIAGGSSSGSAISVADGMCAGALATDTGGSIRTPAALCGLAGFKPTAARVPLQGVFPRSYSLDTAGPIAVTARCCAVIDAALSRCGPVVEVQTRGYELSGLRFAVIEGEPVERLSPEVAAAFSAALTLLSRGSARITSLAMPEIQSIRALNAKGGISPPEAYAIHRDLISSSPELIDPIFLARLRKGGEMRAADYIDALRSRQAIMEDARTRTRAFDAVLMPTCAIVAPPLSAVATAADFEAMSALVLRNCNLANFLDRPALTIPIHREGDAPVGLMLMGERGSDEDLLEIGTIVEEALRRQRGASLL